MKKITIIMLGALFVMSLFLCGNSYAYTCSYKQVVTAPEMPSMVSKVWVDGSNMRVESNAGGEQYVLIMRNDGIYNYIPSQNLVTKVPQMQQRPAYMERPQNYMVFLERQGAKKVGKEKVDSYVCDVYEYKTPMMPGQTKVWLWQKEEFPVKMVMDDLNGNTTEIRFTDISINKPISPKMFQLPSNATMFDATNMGGLAERMKQFAE